jgi:hypothetical protein
MPFPAELQYRQAWITSRLVLLKYAACWNYPVPKAGTTVNRKPLSRNHPFLFGKGDSAFICSSIEIAYNW